MSENKNLKGLLGLSFPNPSGGTLIIFAAALSCFALFGGLKMEAIMQPYRDYTAPLVSKEPSQYQANPTAIHIPSVGIHLPIEESDIVDGVWQVSQTGASHLQTSARPGQSSNIVIYGHNLLSLFGRVRDLNKGDIITLKTAYGSLFTYEVTETMTVQPNQIEVALPTDTETLTLFTCDGLADSIRFVIRAKPVVKTAQL